MPPYSSNQGNNTPVALLQPGVNGYAFGSFPASSPVLRGSITRAGVSSNVGVIEFQLLEGNVPSVGDLISVSGASPSYLNVTSVPLAVVLVSDPLTGLFLVDFALVHADVTFAAASGMISIVPGEAGETLAAGSSQAFAIPDEAGYNENGKTITWSTRYPSAPSGVTMTLQAAMVNEDSQYVTLDTSTNTSGEIRSLTLRLYRFLRVTASGISGGTLPTAVVRLSI